uniref:Uncharacterized protein n=1 Tax=Panagrolaimus davidi TaxID=227884 RepID=A0A914Q606_9BILA
MECVRQQEMSYGGITSLFPMILSASIPTTSMPSSYQTLLYQQQIRQRIHQLQNHITPTAATTPSATSTAPFNFSFMPQTIAVNSEATADIEMEDDGLDSAFAGINICPPTNTGGGYGSTGGFSSFGGNPFGQQEQSSVIPAVRNNPFHGGFAAAAKTNASTFGGTSAFESAVENPFGGGGYTGCSSFGGGFSQQQQQPSSSTTSTSQKNPFGFGSPSTGSTFGGGTSAFAQTAKNPFVATALSTGSGFSSFGKKATAFGSATQAQNISFGGKNAFGGGGSAFDSTTSPFASAASGSVFGGDSGFTSFRNRAGGFGALAQQSTSHNHQSNIGFGSTSAFGGGSAFGSPRQ